MKGQKGFTLIELIIVIAIIAILAAVAIPNYLGFRDRANISAAKESLGSLKTVLEVYRADHGVYPTATDEAGLKSAVTSGTPSYMETSDWDKLVANFDEGKFTSVACSADTYTIKAKAKDRGKTELTLTPTGITP
jgi:type II secretion system protein G